jgi:GDP-4-dehydro-6-deoxy-D-mannose reductase
VRGTVDCEPEAGDTMPRQKKEFPIKLIAEAVVSSPISIEVDPAKLRKIDMPFQVGNNRKIAEETGWAPRISMRQTLRDILAFWRDRLGRES